MRQKQRGTERQKRQREKARDTVIKKDTIKRTKKDRERLREILKVTERQDR